MLVATGIRREHRLAERLHKTEMRELLNYRHDRGVEIVPELARSDIPAIDPPCRLTVTERG